MLACNGRDIFCLKEDDLTDSQLVVAVNTQTQEDPVVPARSAEVEEALQPIHNLCWAVESEQDNPWNPS